MSSESALVIANPTSSKRAQHSDPLLTEATPLGPPQVNPFRWDAEDDDYLALDELEIDKSMGEMQDALLSTGLSLSHWRPICNLMADQLAFPKADVIQWSGTLEQSIHFGGLCDPMDLVISHSLHATNANSLVLHQHLQRVYKGTLIPSSRAGQSKVFAHHIVTRLETKRGVCFWVGRMLSTDAQITTALGGCNPCMWHGPHLLFAA
jgi:hypothetical protein